jgi:hypothetical protein
MQVDDVHQLINSLTPFARLRFPMESAADAARQLPSGPVRVRLEGADVDLRAVLRRVPVHYFPITSLENLLAKGRAVLEANEHRIGVPPQVAPVLRRVGAMLEYPVTEVGQLQRAADKAGVSSVRVGGRRYAVAHVLQSIEGGALPIADVRELYRLARRLSRTGSTAQIASRRH